MNWAVRGRVLPIQDAYRPISLRNEVSEQWTVLFRRGSERHLVAYYSSENVIKGSVNWDERVSTPHILLTPLCHHQSLEGVGYIAHV